VALCTAPRSKRAFYAIGMALVLLFPIVSVSDDLLAGPESFEDALAIVVDVIILLIAFVALTQVEPVRSRRAAYIALVTTDPRSPPRV
jgi:hypothetical protein